MRVPIRLDGLAMGAAPLTLLAWLVEPGDLVTEGDRIAEIAIPGVSRDLESRVEGRVVQLLVSSGTPVEEGQILAWVETDS